MGGCLRRLPTVAPGEILHAHTHVWTDRKQMPQDIEGKASPLRAAVAQSLDKAAYHLLQ